MIKRLPGLVFFLLLVISFQSATAQSLTPLWVNDIGGNGQCQTSGMAVDPLNNVYVTGIFQNMVDFDPSVTRVSTLTSSGGWDVFIAKYQPDGKLVWVKNLTGNALDQSNSLAVDVNGNVTVAGQFGSQQLGAGTITLQNQGYEDSFTVHMDTDGNFLWAKAIGGVGVDRGNDVTTDQVGNVTVVSQFQENIIVGTSTYNSNGTFNGLIVKYSPAGDLIWSINLGKTGDNEARGITTDLDNNTIVSGAYSSIVNYNPLGVETNGSDTGEGTFLAKYSPTGVLIWVKQITGALNNNLSNVCVDTQNDIYLSANFSTALVFDATHTLTPKGQQDIFVSKYTTNGSLLWTKSAGGFNGNPYCYRIVSDATNNVFFTGYYTGTVDFNPDPVVVSNSTYHGARDFFICKYDTDGNYAWAFSYGSSTCSSTFGVELALDKANNILLGGTFCSTVNFDANLCSQYNITAKNTTSDVYIAKYDQNGQFAGAAQLLTFAIPEQVSPAVIDNVNFVITANVPASANLTALKPVITTTLGSVITPASNAPRNFTSPVTYSVANANGCGIVSYSVNMLVNTQASACSGEVIVLSGKALATNPNALGWEVLQGGSWVTAPGIANQSNYETSAFVNFTGVPVIYNLRRKLTRNGINTYDSFYDFTLNPSTEQNTITPDRLLFCPGDINPLIFTGNLPIGYAPVASFRWELSVDNKTWAIIPGASQQTLAYTAKITQATYFRRVTNIASCEAYSNSVKVDAAPPVTTANAGTSISDCRLQHMTLNANIPAANEVGTWEIISPASYNPFSGNSLHNPKATITNIPEDVDVVLKWTISSNICSTQSSNQITIRNKSLPIVSAGANKTIGLGLNTTINSSISSPYPYTYTWSPYQGLNSPLARNPIASPLVTTTYTLTVTNTAGCFTESKVTIEVVNGFTIPNTFTPNGDGVNDKWEIDRLKDYINSEVWIYNRWGQLMYYSRGYATSWDGVYNGKKLPAGVFYYIIAVNEINIRKTGSLTIVY